MFSGEACTLFWYGVERSGVVCEARAGNQEAFEAQDPLFAPLFDFEDATVAIRSETNTLLFSTLELIVCPASPVGDWLEASATVHPLDGKRVLLEIARRLLDTGAPFQGTSDLLGVRFKAHTDPSDSMSDFNAALLKSAKWRITLRSADDEVKKQFISALDNVIYAPVVSGLFTHQQRATADLLAMQQWVSECYARHIQAGFTPQADKDKCKIGHGGGGSGVRFAARDLPAAGNWPQSHGRKRVAFHKSSGEFIPFCGNDTCKKDDARHWHRDCPNGGKHGAGGHFGNFSLGDVENDLLAEQFQVPSALQEFLPYCQSVTHMGSFTVGGVAGGLPSFASTHVREDAPPAPLTVAGTHVGCAGSVVSDEEAPLPVDPMLAHEPDLCFARDASVPTAIPPRKQIRYRQEKQGFRHCRVVPLPPALQDPDPLVPGSSPYSPPPYSSEDEAEASTDNFNIGDSSFCSTNDSAPTVQRFVLATL
ncbi:hypothetical protein CYMTET_23882 [Cymbomonas tetramitiformis]|uniref:Uncharacterized protein n=1 Tax=Cymbomonas tetramitiformis TaxID=36881 RepID=A0AAE0L0H1_9CHLO|nr:hypothetical protein CYMTET_23882 [Cymbomonas tetramitiformis]